MISIQGGNKFKIHFCSSYNLNALAAYNNFKEKYKIESIEGAPQETLNCRWIESEIMRPRFGNSLPLCQWRISCCDTKINQKCSPSAEANPKYDVMCPYEGKSDICSIDISALDCKKRTENPSNEVYSPRSPGSKQ